MLTKTKVHACYTVKVYKNKPFFFSNRGAHARRACHGSAFKRDRCPGGEFLLELENKQQIMQNNMETHHKHKYT